MFKKLLLLLSLVFLTAITGVTAEAVNSLPDVTNLKVTNAGNRTVALSWDPVANASQYILLYGTSSVTTENQQYNRPPIEVGNVTAYTVENLVNGTTYYFTVIAQNNTSISANFATEVSATPTTEGANANPTITAITSLSQTELSLAFSKDMNFSNLATLKSELTIKKTFDETPLAVSSLSKLDNKTLKITTAAQEEGSEYRLIVSDKFKDTTQLSLEEVERGTVFVGFSSSDLLADLFGAAGDASDLTIEKVFVLPDNRSIEVSFSKGVALNETPTSQVAIVETESPTTSSLKIVQVIANPEDNKQVLVVADKPFRSVSHTVMFLSLKDTDGKIIAEKNSTKSFEVTTGVDADTADTSGEVTDLAAKFIDLANLLVEVTWGANPNLSATTLSGYKIYLGLGKNGAYDLLSELPADQLKFLTESLTPAELYRFKVTSLDADGNESQGALLELELPGTGPAALIFLSLSSLGLGRFVTRRKKS